MNIKITKKQNVKVDGVKYVARKGANGGGCAFHVRLVREACGNAPCVPGLRDDGHQVIFVKAEPKWTPINGVIPALQHGTRITWKDKLGARCSSGGTTMGVLNWAIGREDEVTHYRVLG